jgi:PAS domain S-box-containing protein
MAARSGLRSPHRAAAKSSRWPRFFNQEERETFPDGREAWVATTKLPLRGELGEIIGTFGVSQDITTRRRAEQALRDSEERWRTLLDNSQEIVLLVDHDGLLVYASPSVERWLGYRPEEVIGAAFVERSHPDDAAATRQAFADVVPGKPVSLRHCVRHKDGSSRAMESTLVCLREDPAIADRSVPRAALHRRTDQQGS